MRGGRNWGTFIRRTKAPELPVVLLEDTAALIGLAFAFAGVALSVLTGDGRWDGVGSLAIGLLLATAAAILAVEMKSLLIGESASPEMQRMIVAALEDGPELAQVIHMRTVHISPDSILVAAKVEVRDADTAAQVAAAIDTAERRVRSAVPIAKVIYLEPDIYRPAKADQSDPAIRSVRRSQAPVPPSADGGPMKPGNPENPAPQPPPSELRRHPGDRLSHSRRSADALRRIPGDADSVSGSEPRHCRRRGCAAVRGTRARTVSAEDARPHCLALSRGTAGAGRAPSRSPGRGRGWRGCGRGGGRGPRPRRGPAARPAPAGRTPATPG